MKANGLYHAVLYVRDLKQSTAFYQDLLGFVPIGEAFGGKAQAFRGGDHRTHHELLLIEVGDAPHPGSTRRLGLYHLGIKVGDSLEELAKAKSELQLAGVAIDGESDHTVTWSLYIRDPDGNELELYCDNPAIDWKGNPEAVMAPIRRIELEFARPTRLTGQPNPPGMRWLREARGTTIGILMMAVALSGCLGDSGEPNNSTVDSEPFPDAPANNTTAEDPLDNLTEPLNETDNLTFTTVDGSELLYLIEEPTTPIAGESTLVLTAHGYGHSIESHRHHIQEMATWGVTAAVIDYRDNLGMPILWGAQDLIAAREYLHEQYGPFDRTIVYGISLGAATSGTAIAESDGKFDVWFSVEGMANIMETWAAACALAPGIEFAAQACTDIETDAGRGDDGTEGTPCSFPSCPAAFERRAPALRTSEMTELQEVFLIHAAYDGLVPIDQSIELELALQDAGITTHFTAVLRGEEGTDQDTTYASHAIGREHDVDKAHGLSGHGTESDRDQAVVATAMEQLQAYIVDGTVLHGSVVDRR